MRSSRTTLFVFEVARTPLNLTLRVLGRWLPGVNPFPPMFTDWPTEPRRGSTLVMVTANVEAAPVRKRKNAVRPRILLKFIAFVQSTLLILQGIAHCSRSPIQG